MNDAGEIVGMVDVLKLTYATLEQVNIPYIYSLTYYLLHANKFSLDQLYVNC